MRHIREILPGALADIERRFTQANPMKSPHGELFDIAESRRRRDEGIATVEDHAPRWVDRAREIAHAHALKHGTVTADDIRRKISDQPHHPNAFGAIFRDSRFEPTGEFRQSKAVSRHAGMQRVWKLKES